MGSIFAVVRKCDTCTSLCLVLVPVSQGLTLCLGGLVRDSRPLGEKGKFVLCIATRSLELAPVAQGSEVTGIPASSLIGEGRPAILDCNGGIKIDAVSFFFYLFYWLFCATVPMFCRRACSQVSLGDGAFTVLQPRSDERLGP